MYGFFNPFGSQGGGGGGTPQPTSNIHYGTSEYWNRQPDLIAEAGHLYIYSDAKSYNGMLVPRLKIGNGNYKLIDMPFIDCSCTPEPGEPIYIDAPDEAIVDPGVQDIFPVEPEESFSFSGRVGTSADGENEKLYLNF